MERENYEDLAWERFQAQFCDELFKPGIEYLAKDYYADLVLQVSFLITGVLTYRRRMNSNYLPTSTQQIIRAQMKEETKNEGDLDPNRTLFDLAVYEFLDQQMQAMRELIEVQDEIAIAVVKTSKRNCSNHSRAELKKWMKAEVEVRSVMAENILRSPVIIRNKLADLAEDKFVKGPRSKKELRTPNDIGAYILNRNQGFIGGGRTEIGGYRSVGNLVREFLSSNYNSFLNKGFNQLLFELALLAFPQLSLYLAEAVSSGQKKARGGDLRRGGEITDFAENEEGEAVENKEGTLKKQKKPKKPKRKVGRPRLNSLVWE